jgi:hypothetical protein
LPALRSRPFIKLFSWPLLDSKTRPWRFFKIVQSLALVSDDRLTPRQFQEASATSSAPRMQAVFLRNSANYFEKRLSPQRDIYFLTLFCVLWSGGVVVGR